MTATTDRAVIDRFQARLSTARDEFASSQPSEPDRCAWADEHGELLLGGCEILVAAARSAVSPPRDWIPSEIAALRVPAMWRLLSWTATTSLTPRGIARQFAVEIGEVAGRKVTGYGATLANAVLHALECVERSIAEPAHA